MATAYKLSKPRFEYPANLVVYEYLDYDYGLSRDDTLDTGKIHISVCEDPLGRNTPFFTVDFDELIEIKE